MIWALIWGFIWGLVAGVCLWYFLNETLEVSMKRSLIAGFVALVLVYGLRMYIGYVAVNFGLEKDIAKHHSIKQTYEYSLEDPRISGLDRLELTQKIINQNVAVAQKKVGLDRFWNMWYKYDLREEYRNLEPIGSDYDLDDPSSRTQVIIESEESE